MPGSVAVKICGLSTPEMVRVAVEAGATHIGFMFYERSPRNVTVAEAAKLRSLVPDSVQAVAIMVNPDDALVDDVAQTVKPDLLQLHGSETRERVAEISNRAGLPVMKVISVADAADVAAADIYKKVADLLLFDAKPPKSMANALPGGNAVSFDWSLIADADPKLPWMLSGGLTPDNVAEAIAQTGARMVDVSSGVEDAPGQKNEALIRAFVKAAQSA
ncbi:phosphoribosylanthranilate isomerase [Parvibaculaceae bacterium PLY_AMNH_Bact1]|nr:phosphoribosylanthranilate isomerase [Parvibaculaceae bacterium PLY_AMNH_Bact1]